MWVFMQDAMLSIVEPSIQRPETKGRLLVRARVSHDIRRVFPKAAVLMTPARDYRYRAFIPREEVALAISQAVRGINYPNFKDGVRENDRHDAYLGVWSEMHQFQSKRAYPQKQKAAQRKLVYDDDYPGDLLEHRHGFPRGGE